MTRNGTKYLFAILLALSGCGGSGDPAAPDVGEAVEPVKITIVATDFAFSLSPTTLPAGEVSTILVNEGTEPHQAGYYLLNDDVSFEEFVTAITKDDSMIPQLASGGRAGHMRGLSGGESGVRTGDALEAGDYAVLCSIRDPETGKNHYELGMVAELKVR